MTQRPQANQYTSLNYSDNGVSYDRFMVGLSTMGQITVNCNGIVDIRTACNYIYVPKNKTVTITSDSTNLFVYTWK